MLKGVKWDVNSGFTPFAIVIATFNNTNTALQTSDRQDIVAIRQNYLLQRYNCYSSIYSYQTPKIYSYIWYINIYIVLSKIGHPNSNCSTVAHQAPHAAIGAERSMFFLKSGTLIFVLFGIIITDGRLTLWVRSAFALGSLWVRSRSGDKEYSKRDEIDLKVV